MPAINSRRRYEELAVVAHVLQTTQKLVFSRSCLQRTVTKCTTAIVLLIKPFVIWCRCRYRRLLLKLPYYDYVTTFSAIELLGIVRNKRLDERNLIFSKQCVEK